MAISQSRIWTFLASVKLALFSLIVLSLTSIIGTFIDQQKGAEHYIEKYGATAAQIFDLLDFTNMYSSWWFVSLLLLFALNLVVCSIERLPGVWRTVVRKDADIGAEQLQKMSGSNTLVSPLATAGATERVREALADHGWQKPHLRHTTEATSLFVQRGAWTRLAVYVVHLSILLILAGALAGVFFGFKAYVYLPEGRSTDKVFLQNGGDPIALGFQVRGDSYQRTFYANGMVKQHHADLTVLDPKNGDSYRKAILVNDPLSYRGISFYVGDSLPIEEYYVTFRHHPTGTEHAFRVPPKQKFVWPETGIAAQVEEFVRDRAGFVQRARISLSVDPSGAPTQLWIDNNGSATIGQAGREFTLNFRQLSSVLLLVKKDPGVNIVFAGFALMMLGLFVSFFLSHRRIWIHLAPAKQGTRILIGGSANKNRPGFEKVLQKIVAAIEQKGGAR